MSIPMPDTTELPHSKSHEHDDHKEVTIETLSTPPVHVAPAPLQKRFAAGLVDSVLLTAFWAAFLGTSGMGFAFTEITSVYFGVGYFVLLVFSYYFLLEWLFAASIGKWLFKLRVFGTDGELCSMNASLLRNLVRFVDWLPSFYLIGLLSLVVSRDRQRIGDRVASTVVSLAPAKDINPPPAPFLFH
jgi:uncharacterized RDD family membrane protein YckC